MSKPDDKSPDNLSPEADLSAKKPAAAQKPPKEFGGPTGPEPTRYGDWERNGKVSDF